ncbi:MAG: hypothetical protein ACI9HE_001392 [Planctomycetota bacterium]|jgi:hypothetical protein
MPVNRSIGGEFLAFPDQTEILLRWLHRKNHTRFALPHDSWVCSRDVM